MPVYEAATSPTAPKQRTGRERRRGWLRDGAEVVSKHPKAPSVIPTHRRVDAGARLRLEERQCREDEPVGHVWDELAREAVVGEVLVRVLEEGEREVANEHCSGGWWSGLTPRHSCASTAGRIVDTHPGPSLCRSS